MVPATNKLNDLAEHIDGSPFLDDMDIKRALRNKVFLSLPEILCERIK